MYMLALAFDLEPKRMEREFKKTNSIHKSILFDFSASFFTLRLCLHSVCAFIRNKFALKCCENIEKSFKLWFICERPNK